MSTFGGRLKRARLVAGLTQGGLAIACGWGKDQKASPEELQSRVSNYERNKREPDLADVRAMAKVLDMDPAELLFGHPMTPDAVEEKILNAYRAASKEAKSFIVQTCEAVAPERRGAKRRNVK